MFEDDGRWLALAWVVRDGGGLWVVDGAWQTGLFGGEWWR
jgi:hypothetical protein